MNASLSLSLYRNRHTPPPLTDSVPKQIATPPKEISSVKCVALAVGSIVESGVALITTNQRFHKQSNTINKSTHPLSAQALVRGYPFFPVVRTVQLSSMFQAKEAGIGFAKTLLPEASPSTYALTGALCSSLTGLPFNYPMEWILLDGVKASHNNSAFSLCDAAKKLWAETRHCRLRGIAPTLMRDLPFGASVATLPSLLEEKLHPPLAEYLSIASIKTLASLTSAAAFCIGTQPADVIKTTLLNNPSLPNKTLTIGQMIYNTRGWSALFSGLAARYCKVAATFLILNNGVPQLEKHLSRRLA
jgi:hypothetical protein